MIKQYETLTKSYDDAQLDHDESKVNVIGTGILITVSKFKLSVPYKRHLIVIHNEYGTNNSATVSMKIEKGFISEFEINSRNHLKNLFDRKKKYFEVDCSNNQFKISLEDALVISGMEAIVMKNLFEPTVQVERIDGVYFINTAYHLQLKDKIGAVKALIDFYKEIVDHL